jgi:hypothetical protein
MWSTRRSLEVVMPGTWLERLRQKNVEDRDPGSAKSAKIEDEQTSVTCGTESATDLLDFCDPKIVQGRRECSAKSAKSGEVLTVPYQRIWFDYDIPDRTYTPEQLRKARKWVYPWGKVACYLLTETATGARFSGMLPPELVTKDASPW